MEARARLRVVLERTSERALILLQLESSSFEGFLVLPAFMLLLPPKHETAKLLAGWIMCMCTNAESHRPIFLGPEDNYRFVSVVHVCIIVSYVKRSGWPAPRALNVL
jgi:hypothetical protein